MIGNKIPFPFSTHTCFPILALCYNCGLFSSHLLLSPGTFLKLLLLLIFMAIVQKGLMFILLTAVQAEKMVLMSCWLSGLHKHIARNIMMTKYLQMAQYFSNGYFINEKLISFILIYWKFRLGHWATSLKKYSTQKWLKRFGSKICICGFCLNFGHLISFAGCCLLSDSQNEFCLVSGILNCPSISSHHKYIIAVTNFLEVLNFLGIRNRASPFGIVMSSQSQFELPLWFILLLHFATWVNDNFLTACKFRKEKSLLQFVFGC